MVLEILILSALRAGPMHGYELKRQVQRPTLTRLGNSSLYPALSRFEQSGALTQRLEVQDGKPSRKVYTITEAGVAEFHELISTLPTELATSDEEFLVRVSFFSELSAAERISILSARAAVLDGRIAQVDSLINGRERADKNDWPSRATGQFLLRLKSEREWIEQMTLEQHEGHNHD